jgi:phosphohistidine phosphatase SixA
MLVYLMRHGEAEPQGQSDQTRELTRKGVMDSRAAMEQLKARGPQIDKAMMSPYQRARQTITALRLVSPTLRYEVNQNLVPEANVYDLLDSFESINVMQLFLVSHNPLLSNLLALMVDGTLETDRQMGCSEIACVSMDIIAPGCGELLYTIRP